MTNAVVYTLLLCSLLRSGTGFLLEPATSQSIRAKLARVANLDDLREVLTMLTKEVADLQHMASLHDPDFNSLQGSVNTIEQNIQFMKQASGNITANYINPALAATTQAPNASLPSEGATYVRWGRTTCPPEADLVYSGYAGGGHYNERGSATNYLCLPDKPQYGDYIATKSTSYYAHTFGAEFQIPYNPLPNFQDANFVNMYCAVCRSPTRRQAVVLPARTSCYSGFHLEYTGYLMANYYGYAASYQFACVDAEPEKNLTTNKNEGGAGFYYSTCKCGSLPCPPYEEMREIACAVCSK